VAWLSRAGIETWEADEIDARWLVIVVTPRHR